MVLTFLNDFSKRATDLWKSKKFKFNKTLEVNVDKSNNMSWTGKHVLMENANPETEIKVCQKEKGLGQCEFTLANGGKQSMKFEAKSKELIDNVELEAEIERMDKGKFTATMRPNDNMAAKVQAKYSDSNLCVEGQVSYAVENVTLGAHGVMNGEGAFEQYNVGVRLDQDNNRTYSLKSSNKFENIEVAFYYKVSGDAEIGTQVDINMLKSNIGVTAGGSYKLDGNSKLRYSLDSKGQLGLAYEYKFSDRVQGFMGTGYSLTENKIVDNISYKLTFDV